LDKVRVLIIGVGGMGRAHIRRLNRIPEVEIVAFADPADTSIAATKEAYPDLADVASYRDYRIALKEAQPDAAVIVSPHSDHLEHGLACLNAGVHVLMEKPFVAGSANAEHLIDVAKERGKHLAVAYQRHLEGAYMFLHDLVQNGELGEVQFVSAYQAQAWLKGTAGTWRQDPELSAGGQLNDSGSHLLDIVLWITGLEPEVVNAFIDNRGTKVDIDTALSVRMKGGAIANFNIVGSATIGWHEDVSVHGTKGTALFRNGTLLVAREGENSVKEMTAELPKTSDPDQDFVNLLLGRIEHAAAPAECGLAVARLTEAAWKSAELGRPVTIAEAGSL